MKRWQEIKEMRSKDGRSYSEKSKVKEMLKELKEEIKDLYELAEDVCKEMDDNYSERREWNIIEK